jgi:pyruvate/2-oxoglutarate dehydrogenase complex dihydrolipoamide dehydrogenase (E3) component
MREEPEAAAIVQTAMGRDGIQFRFGAEITRVAQQGAEHRVWLRLGGRDEQLSGDHLLLALGRTPNVDGMGLDAAGIAYDVHGVHVDDYLRTTNPRIFAAGDICTREHFTHVADAHARLVVRNALFASNVRFGYGRASSLVIPRCTFTSPELAQVGWTPGSLRQDTGAVDTIAVDLAAVDRAVLAGADAGTLRVHVRAGTDRIIGATLVADGAGDYISEITLAMTNRLGLRSIGRTIHPYPTQAEVVRKAADSWSRSRLTPRLKRVLGFFFRRLV